MKNAARHGAITFISTIAGAAVAYAMHGDDSAGIAVAILGLALIFGFLASLTFME